MAKDTTESDFESEGGSLLAAGRTHDDAPAEPQDEPSGGLVRLTLAGPLHATSFTGESPEGDTLTVDREGLDVERELADHMTELAARSGLTLTTKEL